jgi:hypothetical protein
VVGFQKKSRQPDEEVETGEVTAAMGLGAGQQERVEGVWPRL